MRATILAIAQKAKRGAATLPPRSIVTNAIVYSGHVTVWRQCGGGGKKSLVADVRRKTPYLRPSGDGASGSNGALLADESDAWCPRQTQPIEHFCRLDSLI